ncbi:MAG: ABC transporter permease subunit [Isosphaeraceae bacterium]|nr:ABC transporter permease subunit [Isosphaeraceae bacterium]
MVLALVRKELRETLAFAVLALAFYLAYLSNLTGKGGPLLRPLVGLVPGMNVKPSDIPFIQDNFTTMLFFIGGVLAIALGFRQSAWEPSQGTALYLLHLPLPRRTIVATKLLTGIGLLLVCTLLPILIYATWAALPQTHAGPFEWTMTGDAFRVWLLLPLVYLGAFASGIRPARWFGSRLLPLASVAIPAMFSYVVGPWWLIVPVAAVFVSVILWETATRDF